MYQVFKQINKRNYKMRIAEMNPAITEMCSKSNTYVSTLTTFPVPVTNEYLLHSGSQIEI